MKPLKYLVVLFSIALLQVWSQEVQDCPTQTVNHYHYSSSNEEGQTPRYTSDQAMVGKPGKVGPPGPKGSVGAKGDKGDTGECACQLNEKITALETELGDLKSLLKQDECFSNPCFNNATCTDIFDGYHCTCAPGYNGVTCQEEVRECSEFPESGVYTIKPLVNVSPFEVLCDNDIDGGNWLVIQRRFDGSENFERNWFAYENGFGRMNSEFWLGLKKMHQLTDEDCYELRVDLEDWEGNTRYAKYRNFHIESSDENYKLMISGYSGNAGDAFTGDSVNINGMPFSTADRDNDPHSTHNCAAGVKGAWWFNNCFRVHLNAKYWTQPNAAPKWEGIIWNIWKGSQYSLKRAEMKIRKKAT